MKRLHEIVTSLDSQTTSGAHRAQQKFSKQQGGQKRQNMSTLKRALNLLSGGDQAAMLEELNSCFVGPELYETMTKRHEQCLANIRDGFYATSQNERVRVLSLVAKSYPAKFLKEIGFEFPLSLYQSARKFTRAPPNPLADQKPFQLGLPIPPFPGMFPGPRPLVFPDGSLNQVPILPNFGSPMDQKLFPNQGILPNQRPMQSPGMTPGVYPSPMLNNEMPPNQEGHPGGMLPYGYFPEHEAARYDERFINQKTGLNPSELSKPQTQPQILPQSPEDVMDEKGKKKTPKKNNSKDDKITSKKSDDKNKAPAELEEHKKSLKRRLDELLTSYSDVPSKHRKSSPFNDLFI